MQRGKVSPSYSSGWCRSFYRIADLLPRLGVDIWDNPKLKKMADIGIDMTVAGRFCPDIGDSGGIKGSGPIARSAELQGRACPQRIITALADNTSCPLSRSTGWDRAAAA